MAASITRYQDSQYKAWLKSQLGLYEVRDALCPVTQKVITAFHTGVKAKLGTPTGAMLCCSETDVFFDRTTKQCKLRPACRSNICDKWVLEISQSHINPREIKWACTKLADWVVQPWEIAKLFLPGGQPRGTSTPAQHDPAALFNLIMKCKEFPGWKTYINLVQTLIEIRNKLCHSTSLKVNATDMADYFQRMFDFLKHPALAKDVNVAQLKIDLVKIRDTDVCITPEKETNVIAQLLLEMQTRFRKLHCKCGRLEIAGAKHDVDIQEIKDRVDEMQIFCQFLGDQEDLLDRMPHDLIKVKNDLELNVNELKEKLESHVGDVEEVVKTASKTASKAKGKATHSKGKACMTSGKIKYVEEIVEKHESRIEALEGHFKARSGEYVHVADQINENKNEISTVKKENQRLTARFTAAEQEREQLTARFKSLKEKVAACLKAKQLSSSRSASRKRGFVDDNTHDVKHNKDMKRPKGERGEEDKVSAKASSSEQSATTPYSSVDMTDANTDRHHKPPRRGKNILHVVNPTYARDAKD